MNFRRLSDKELADFAANVVSQLGGTELKAINAAVRTALVAEIGTAPADLSVQSASASVAVLKTLKPSLAFVCTIFLYN